MDLLIQHLHPPLATITDTARRGRMWDDSGMDAQDLGPLRARILTKTSGTTPKKTSDRPLTVVLMHGFGAPGDDLVALAGAIQAPAGTTFVFPEAPLELSDPNMPFLTDARAWWLIDIERFQRATVSGDVEQLVKDEPSGLTEAREKVIAMLDALEKKVPGQRLVIGGFSQGSMIATDVALRDPRALAGLVIMSGTLIAAETWLPALPSRASLPVFQSHGTMDPLLPFQLAQLLNQEMKQAGLAASFVGFEGAHGIPPVILRDLGTWLTQI